MERPQWSALGSMIDDLRQSLAGIEETRARLVKVTGVAWSDDRLIKAVVGPRGQVIDLEIDPRIYRSPNSQQLAMTIVATIKAAVADAAAKTQEIVASALPRDRGLDLLGNSDMERALTSHDADLPRLFGEGDRGNVR